MQAVRDIAANITGNTPDLALPRGSLILVTGASGYIGSHVVNEALRAGYRVRGTARSEAKCASTAEIFQHDPNYSTAVVPDFQHAGAFDEAIQGVDAVVHVASDTTFSHEPDKVVKPVVDGVLSLLRSAAKTSSVKRFVLTSSSAAVLMPQTDTEISVTADDWNQAAIDAAYAPPPYTADRAFAVYAASKTEGEKAFWKFLKEEKPGFIGNAVLPNCNMGRVLSAPGPTGGAVISILNGTVPNMPPQYMIDVIDDARIHFIAAALDPSLENQRIFAFNAPFNWTEVIAAVKEARPRATGIADPPENEGRDLSKVPNELGAELLKKWYGQQSGYKPFKQTVAENLEGH